MLRLAKIVRFPERHCPSTVVDGAGALGFAQGESFCVRGWLILFIDLWRPTVRDSIHRDREKGLLGSRHAVFADGRSESRAFLSNNCPIDNSTCLPGGR